MCNSLVKGKTLIMGTKKNTTMGNGISYVNIKRSASGYKDKYKKDVDKALEKYSEKIGKTYSNGDNFTQDEWKNFFRTVLIPLDKESERKMIDLFSYDRKTLNELLVLHNTLAANNLAEVYYKKYEKECPTHWYDLEDFKQQALLGLAEGAKRFDLNRGDKFITYATWWMLNKVRKPRQEKGANDFHVSLSVKTDPTDSDDDSTFEDILTPSMVSPDWKSSSVNEEYVDPAKLIDKGNIDSIENLFDNTISSNTNISSELDKSRIIKLNRYLMTIVERNSKSYQDSQILLYMFKKLFKKCNDIFEPNSIDASKLTKYVTEAPKSKADLLRKLNMDESQYKVACKDLIKRNWGDGIRF